MAKLSNEEILKHLEKRDGEYDTERTQAGHSVNAEMVRLCISDWDNGQFFFPHVELRRYIRFAEWTAKDFNFENEMLIQKYLPDFVHDIFFEMKEFRENSRRELLSTQEAFGRMMGLPYKTQDEKALVVYNYAYQKYYEDSKIHAQPEGEQDEKDS